MAESDNYLRWDGDRRKYYEVYFLKFNDPRRQLAAWIRYTLLSPVQGDPVAEVWSFFFHRYQHEDNLALRDTYSWNEAKHGQNPFFYQIGNSIIRHDGAQGAIEKGDKRMAWDIKWEHTEHPLCHFPYRWMYRAPFPRTKMISPHPNLCVSGTLEVGKDSYHFDRAPGQQSHLWGTEYANSWVWSHCNSFNEESALWEGLSARIRIGPWRSPAITIFFLHFRNRLYLIHSFTSILRNKSKSELGLWKFQGQGNGISITGEASANFEDMLGAQYTDPNGEKRWCHNSKLGDLKLHIITADSAKTTLTATGTCAIEWVQREPDDRVKLWAGV